MTACQQGQPTSVNRGGVETVTTGNNDQSSVVAALMRSCADRKDGIIALGLTCVVSGLSSSPKEQIMSSLGGIKLYGQHVSNREAPTAESVFISGLLFTTAVTNLLASRTLKIPQQDWVETDWLLRFPVTPEP